MLSYMESAGNTKHVDIKYVFVSCVESC